MDIIKAVASAALLICMYSCNDTVIFDEIYTLEADKWNANEPVKFQINVSDTTKAYDILMHIRNNNSYKYSNLWMFIETTSPNGAYMRDTVEFVLANPSGQWYGKGLGSVSSLLVPYKKNIRFPYRGIYSFKFQHAMRQEIVYGIKDIGLRVQLH